MISSHLSMCIYIYIYTLLKCKLPYYFEGVNSTTDLRKGSRVCAGVGGPGPAGGGISASKGMAPPSAQHYIYDDFGLVGCCGGIGVGGLEKSTMEKMVWLGPSSFVLQGLGPFQVISHGLIVVWGLLKGGNGGRRGRVDRGKG